MADKTLKKLDDATKRLARKTGKLPKAPKKPKKSSSLAVKENYISRYNDYVDRVKGMATDAKKEQAIDKKIYRG